MTTTMDVNQAEQHLAELLELAKQGNEVLISQGDMVARLTVVAPASSTPKPRVAGLHAGGVNDELERRTCGHLFILGPCAKAPQDGAGQVEDCR